MPAALPFVTQLAVPLALHAMQANRENQARNEINQAEEAEIPGEQSQIAQQMIERGLGATSATRSFINEPRRQFDVSRRIARARDVLQTPTANPLAAMLSDLSRRQGGAEGFAPQQQQFNPYNWFRRPQPQQPFFMNDDYTA